MKDILIISILATVTASAATPSSRHVYDPTDYGAKPDGKTLCTAAIQKAIDECSAQGGGTVRLSGGRFLSGTVFMKSKVTLEIAEGSTLLGSKDLKDYPLTRPDYRSYTDNYTERSVIYGEELTDIAIKGKGAFDGQGESFEITRSFKLRPYGIRLVRCTNVTVEDLKMRNSAMWMQHYLACDGVTIRNITVLSHSNANNDGLDIDSCQKVLVEGCVIDSGDDAICLKSTSPRACEDVTIRNCTVASQGNAIKCGTESVGGFKNVTISHCTVKAPSSEGRFRVRNTGLAGVALEIVDGGTMDQVNVSDIEIEGTMVPIFIRLGDRGRPYQQDAPRPGVGVLRNVTISGIRASSTDAMGCAVAGLKGHPIESLTLRDIRIQFPGNGLATDRLRSFDEKARAYPECKMFAKRLPAYGFYFWHVRGLAIIDMALTTTAADARPAVGLEDASNVSMDGKALADGGDLPPGVARVQGKQADPADAPKAPPPGRTARQPEG
jgi:polygalacturonase